MPQFGGYDPVGLAPPDAWVIEDKSRMGAPKILVKTGDPAAVRLCQSRALALAVRERHSRFCAWARCVAGRRVRRIPQ
jgi:hypothetical protein